MLGTSFPILCTCALFICSPWHTLCLLLLLYYNIIILLLRYCDAYVLLCFVMFTDTHGWPGSCLDLDLCFPVPQTRMAAVTWEDPAVNFSFHDYNCLYLRHRGSDIILPECYSSEM